MVADHVFQIVTPDMAVPIVSHPGMTVVRPLVERGRRGSCSAVNR